MFGSIWISLFFKHVTYRLRLHLKLLNLYVEVYKLNHKEI